MSEAHAKDHPVAGLIMVLIISALCGWGLGIMAGGTFVTGLPAGVLLFLAGAYVVLALGPDDQHAHDGH